MTPSREHVGSFDIEQVEDINENVKLFTSTWTKIKSQKLVKKHESQVGEHDKLKLKVVALHDGIGKEVHMTQPTRFAAKDLIPVAWARWSSFNELRMAWSLNQGTYAAT